MQARLILWQQPRLVGGWHQHCNMPTKRAGAQIEDERTYSAGKLILLKGCMCASESTTGIVHLRGGGNAWRGCCLLMLARPFHSGLYHTL